MKKSVFLCLAFAFTFTAGLFGASSKYYSAYNGEVKSLAIPEPKGVNVKTSETWYLTLIQTQLTDQFRKFSPIVIVDRQNEALADMEIANSENGSYDEDDFVEFGKKANAKYLLIGQLTNLEDSFSLSLRVNNIETNSVAYSYSKNCFAADIKSGAAVNLALETLLKDMGVVLTSEGLRELRSAVDENTVKGQQNLSRSIDASKRGTSVEALNYLFQAQSYTLENSEIDARLNALNSAIITGNVGDQARNEQQIYDYWKKTLSEAEQFYTENPPYEILYSTVPKKTNQNFEKRTIDLSFSVCAVASPSAKNVIKALRSGIENSPESVRSKFSRWPYNSVGVGTKWRDPSNIIVDFYLYDENNRYLGSTKANVYLTGPYIESDKALTLNDLNESNLRQITFKDINIDRVTDSLKLQIAGVNLGRTPVELDQIRILTIDSYQVDLKKQAVIDQRNQELLKKKEIKDLKKKYRRRETFYADYSMAMNDYRDAVGITVGYEKKIIPFIFWGVEGGLYGIDSENKETTLFSTAIVGELGINIPFGEYGTLYTKSGTGFSTSNYASGGGFLTRSAIGFELYNFLRIEYSLDYVLFGCFSDRVNIGLGFPLNLM